MFVRSKDLDGNNVTLVADTIVAMVESTATKTPTDPVAGGETAAEPETVRFTIVSLSNSAMFYVVDSERVIRSKIEKALDGSASAEA